MQKKAVLLTNLGSPNSPRVNDVRSYLNEFLMDGRVIDVPFLLRLFLVRGIIVPFRAAQSAKKYRSIWTEKGSPLIAITDDLTNLLEKESRLPAYMCMRYAHPTPSHALKRIQESHPQLEELIVFPLYPHYAMSSYETAVEHIQSSYAKAKYSFKIKFIKPFYNHPSYIKSLGESIAPYIAKDYDRLLFSYHGIPERHIRKSDPTRAHCLKNSDCCRTPSSAHAYCYRHQVMETTRLTAASLGISHEKWSVSFQSRLGRDKWLAPATAEVLKTLPKEGVKDVVVVCPAFVSDCLETLEEIHEEGREIFMHNGGRSFSVVPCLNTHPSWVQTMRELINEAAI